MSGSTIIFTIVSANYLHFARTLMESVGIAHPQWRRFVLLVDKRPPDFDPRVEPFEILDVSELPLPGGLKFYFRYTILELNTAVKPWMFDWLFNELAAERVVYLDPDICVYRPLTEVESALASGSMMVLTPHLTGHLDDEHRPHELDIVKAGSYNLGFLALARQPSTTRFLAWWRSKLELHCVVDHASGLFVDQKWFDLAPGMFEKVSILRHEGYNVAYWNLAHRAVVSRGNEYLVNGQPLVFYHYSGLNPESPEGLSKYQDRFRLSELGGVRELFQAYIDRLRANGSNQASRYRYAYGYFTNGEGIPDCIRQLYRHDMDFQESAGENPFVLNAEYLNRPLGDGGEGSCPVTVLMRHVWSIRPDVQQAFPRIFAEDRVRFAEWFVDAGAAEYGIPKACVAPVAGALVRLGGRPIPGIAALPTGYPPTAATGACVAPVAEVLARSEAALPMSSSSAIPLGHARVATIDDVLDLDDAEFVMAAYRVVLQRVPDPAGFQHFLDALRDGRTKVEVLLRLRYSPEGRRLRTPLPLPGVLRRYIGARLRRIVTRRRRGAPTIALAQNPERVQPATIPNATAASLDALPRERWDAVAHRRFGRSDYIGFYDWGDEHSGVVWMGKSASVRLKNYQAGKLRVTGSYDALHQRQANGTAATRIEIAVNDRTVGSFVLDSSGPFDVKVDLPTAQPEAPIFLTLTAEQTFVPAKIGLNADPRELSIRIARIEANGCRVLDFTRAQSPYVVAGDGSTAPGINIVGYVRSEHGIGESARLCAGSASAVDLPFVLYDFNAGNAARTKDLSWGSRIATDNPHPVNVFHINADQMTLARETLGEAFYRDRYNIGFWHWELPEFPDRFKSGFAFLDEVWVPSHFVMDSVSAKSPVPVVRMPHAVEFNVDPSVHRDRFGLPDGRFLFLTMYDMHSAQGRKNPHAVIAAYRHAFLKGHDVGLVVKVQNTHSYPIEFEELKREISDYPGILLIDRTLSRDEIYQLEMLCDCFVSLHRSEGFGLGLAESMFLGKVAIGTNWSGNVDFMDHGNSCPVDYRLITLDRDYGPYYKRGNTWADPDVGHAAWYMAKVVNDRAWSQRIAAEGQRTMRTEFSRRRVGELYRKRLHEIAASSAIEWSPSATASARQPSDDRVYLS